jgi:small-conductance mechanosensitive channel
MSSRKKKRSMNMAPEQKANAPEVKDESVTNEQLIAMIKEKIEEKNEVIREQQIQMQELQDKVGELEQEVAATKKAKRDREELVKKISEILE